MKPPLLTNLIEQWLDYYISESDLITLKAELLANKESLEHYVELAEMHSLLSQTQVQTLSQTSVVPMDRIISRQKRKTFRIVALATAAILMIGLLVMSLFSFDAGPPLAFKSAPGTQFIVTHSTELKEKPKGLVLLKGSSLNVTQGTIELTFKSGVRSVLQAPASITLSGDDTLYMHEGTAWFEVPSGAEGFTVNTSDLNIVDLGTEFGVISTPKDHDEIHVIKGKVNASALRHKKEFATLSAGDARRVDPVGRLTAIPVKPLSFLTSLPSSLPYLHWSFDEVKNGGFPSKGNHPQIELGLALPNNSRAVALQTPGRFGKAVCFTGEKGEELLTQWPGIGGDAPRSIACWIRVSPDSLSSFGTSIAAWGKVRDNNLNSNTKWKLAISPDGRLAVVGYNGSLGGGPVIADNQWHHIACTHKVNDKGSSTVSLYVDGQLVNNSWRPDPALRAASSAAMIPINTDIRAEGSLPLRFGVSLIPSAPIKGCLDEVYIFEGELDAETIKKLATINKL